MVTVTVPTNKGVYPAIQDHCACFVTDEFLLVAASKATVTFVFATGVTNPSGETFTVFGRIFTTSNLQPFTSDTFDSSISGQTSADNFAGMLNLNVFSKSMVITVTDQGGGTWHVEIVAKLSGEDLTYADIAFGGLTNPYSFINLSVGADPVFQEGYEIQWQMLDADGNEICGVQFIKPSYDYNTDLVVQPPCLNLSNLITSVLASPVPDISILNPYYVVPQYRVFNLCFWGAYDNGAVKELNQLNVSTPWAVINAALEYGEDFSEFFWGGAPYRFLTNKPIKAFCQTGKNILYGWVEETKHALLPIAPGEVIFWARNVNGARTYEPYGTGVIAVPLDMTAGTYTIKIEAVVLDGLGNPQAFTDVVGPITITVSDTDCKEKLFFLNNKGGYDSVDFFRLDTEAVTTNGFLICKDVECGSSNSRSQVVSEAFEQITLSTKAMNLTNGMLKWIKEFKASETKLIMWDDGTGTLTLRRFIVDYGAFNVWQNDGAITITVSGRFSQNLKVVSE